MKRWLLWALLICRASAEPAVRVEVVPPEAQFRVYDRSGAGLAGGPDPQQLLSSGTQFLSHNGDHCGLVVSVQQPGYADFEQSYDLVRGDSRWRGTGWVIRLELQPVGAWNVMRHQLRFHSSPLYPGLACLGLLLLGLNRARRRPPPLANPEPKPTGNDFEHGLVGLQLYGYAIEDMLGEGSYAQVFLARSLASGEAFALKILRPYLAEGTGLQRISRELEIGLRLNHPCLVRIVGSGIYRGAPYLMMDFVKGETLAALLGRERLALERAVQLLDLMCQGVEYAHAQGIMHRDLKPDNIMLMADGGLKVLDFGVARPTGDWAQLTGTGQAIGTPAYMAPEQLLGNPGFTSDIYALGIILFMMVQGRLPFSGPDVVSDHLNTPVPPLDSGWPWLDALFLSMLEKSQTRRVASVSAVLKILKDNGGTWNFP